MPLKTTRFDPAKLLVNEAAIAAYLSDMIEDGNPELLAAALGDVARARGMTQVAKDAGLTREALYKALRPGAQPRLGTIARVCTALGCGCCATWCRCWPMSASPCPSTSLTTGWPKVRR